MHSFRAVAFERQSNNNETAGSETARARRQDGRDMTVERMGHEGAGQPSIEESLAGDAAAGGFACLRGQSCVRIPG
jgi:hypothetical protein